jgi:hypothetical protein
VPHFQQTLTVVKLLEPHFEHAVRPADWVMAFDPIPSALGRGSVDLAGAGLGGSSLPLSPRLTKSNGPAVMLAGPFGG